MAKLKYEAVAAVAEDRPYEFPYEVREAERSTFVSEEIYEKLTEILHDVFDDDSLVATPGLTAKDVDAWDSVSNVRLFVAIEAELGVQFSNAEITQLSNVGELVAAIDRKQRAR